jgi:pimeloyl-ACP methyl ester carboxylesterase
MDHCPAQATSAVHASRASNAPHHSMGLMAGALLASAAVLGGAACLVQARARRAEREHPARGRFVEVDGVRLHYIERGEGSPVVLLHGNGVAIQDWEISGVLALAAERHRVVAFDRPGFGYSERPRGRIWTPGAQADLIHHAYRSVGIERPIVVAHSWGTQVALALALAHPEDVRGLVLLSGYYFPTVRADVPLLAPPAIPMVGDLMRYTVSPLLGRALAPKMIRKAFAPAPVAPRFSAEFPIDLALRPSQLRASAADTALMTPAAAALSRRYGELAMPVAIMAGLDDQIADVGRQSKRLHNEISGSGLRLVEGGGHMIHHLAPREVLQLVGEIEARSGDRTARRRHAAE